jgi:CheY-like chemotaxis protein
MLTVLLVEDHPLNRKLFHDLLSMQFAVMEADSAEQARERLQSNTPDLILMDLQLPGMDGLSLVRLLKEDSATQSIPVVAISAYSTRCDVEQARAAGCVDYITKPITDEPFALLARLVRAASAPPPTEPPAHWPDRGRWDRDTYPDGSIDGDGHVKTASRMRMSHELHTPLNTVIGLSRLLSTQRYGPLNARQADYVQDIAQAGERLLALVDDIFDLDKDGEKKS